jgi:Protein of unknown function (DUF4238)
MMKKPHKNNVPKKHHYVPQFLLRNFAFKQKKNKKTTAKIWVFDKKENRIFPSAINNIAHENNFYKLPNVDGKNSVDLEFFLEYVDTEASKVILKIVKDAHLCMLTDDDFSCLAEFFAVQMSRVPAVESAFVEMRKEMVKRFGHDLRLGNDEKTIGEFTGEYDKALALSAMIESSKKLCNGLLTNKAILLMQAGVHNEFIISDNPVIKENNISQPTPMGNLGVMSKGIQLHLPVAADLQICYICLHAFNLWSPYIDKQLNNSLDLGVPYILSDENVIHYNAMQVNSAERYVYSRKKEALGLAQQMLKDNPEIANNPKLVFN